MTWARRIGVGLVLAVHVGLLTALVVLAVAVPPVGGDVGLAGTGLSELTVLIPPITFVAVGALLVSRVPRNPTGWALSAYGLNFAATVFAESYVTASAARLSPFAFAEVAAWFHTWNWALGLMALTMLLVHFPSGSLPSPAWRWLRRLAGVLCILIVVAWIDVWSVRFDPTLVESAQAYPPLATAIQSVAEPGSLLLVLVGCSSLVMRYRRAGILERLQLRWLFFAGATAVTGLMVFLFTGSSPSRQAPAVAEILTLLGLAAIPIGIGVAVLRHRLYELDRVISRTVSYGLISAILVGVYALGVLGVGAVLPGEPSDLLVAGSTLAVAALFRPLRARIQSLVDRRFNRARYDAVRTVESFSAQLRDEVAVDAVADELVTTVVAAMAPRRSTLWLAEAPR